MRLLAPKMSFIGLDNWKRLFSDRNALTVLGNTLTIVFVGCFIQYSIGMLLAILVNMNVKFLKFFRIVFLLPMMVAPIAISYVIGKMVFSESYGPINDILFRVGLPIFQWTDNPLRSMAIVIGIDTWSNVPFFILVLLGGLQAIPDDLIEAARVDGATDLDLFTQIIFPLMIPISITTIMIRALNAFQIIDVIRIITGGGPGNATESATLFAYDIGIKGQDIGYGSTVSFALLIVIALFTIIYLLIGRKVTVKK
jgi:multiple sugar transport system permease protein